MALIECEECGKDVSDKADKCMHCGVRIPQVAPTIIAGGFIILILVFIIFQLCSDIFFDKPQTNKNKQQQHQILAKKSVGMVEKLIDGGFVKKVTPELNKAYVDVFLWSSADIVKKKAMGRALAYYCGYKKGTNLNWVEIYDWKSGKKIAKYSQAMGFKVY